MRIVELRIHGVSGTPAWEMLQTDIDHPLTAADVVQVAGDDQTRFFRVRSAAGGPATPATAESTADISTADVSIAAAEESIGTAPSLEPSHRAPGHPTEIGLTAEQDSHGSWSHVREAYHWGQLTSGTWTKSLWLVLVPFGLINAAHFMLPERIQSLPERSAVAQRGDWTAARESDRVADDGAGDRVGPRTGQLARTVAEAMLRALGLLVSVAFLLAIAEALVDQTAWQWTGLPGSGQLARTPDPRGWLLGALLVSAAIPVIILLFAGRRAPGAGEPVAPIDRSVRPDLGPPPSGLTDAEFDVGDPDIPTLARLHLAADWALLGILGFGVQSNPGGGPARWSQWWSSGWLVACQVIGLAALVLVVLIGNPHRQAAGSDAADSPSGRGSTRRRTVTRIIGLVALAAGLVVLVAGCVSVIRTPGINRGASGSVSSGRGPLPGVAFAALVLLIGTIAVLVVLAVATVILARRTRGRDVPVPFVRYLKGCTAPILASVGTFLGVGFGAALVFGVQRLLNTRIAAGYRLVLPAIFQRIAHAWGVTVLVLVLVAAVLFGLKRLQQHKFRTAVELAHNATLASPHKRDGLARKDDLTKSEIGQVASAWWIARIKLHIEWIFLTLAVVGLLLTVLTALAARRDYAGADPTVCQDTGFPAGTRVLGALVSCSQYGGSALVAIGSLVLLGLAVGLVYLGRRSLKDSSLRRSLNVVWDVIAFWPRAAHPLVPPPYTAKAIDQLRRRIYFHLGLCACPDRHRRLCTCARAPQPADQVILAAHSQGSLVTVAALAGLRLHRPPQAGEPAAAAPVRTDQLALLTFGSQLQLAYARGFPRYVNVDFLRWLLRLFDSGAGQVGWISLLRETDPIGGQVLSADRSMDDRPARSWRLLATGEGGEQPDRLAAGGVRRCGPEWRLLDPAPTDAQSETRRKMLQHSGYFLDPAWRVAIEELRRR